MEHTPYLHLVDLDYCARACVTGIDCPRALLIVEKCPCGADTVRPYGDDLIALMEDEWGVKHEVDHRALQYVLSLTYDPFERDDLAEREVWPEVAHA